MKIKDYIFYTILIVFVIFFIASAIIFKVYQIEILPSQFFGALIGVFITAIVTAFLLRGQTDGDEKRERSIKIFEKKQEVYHTFIKKLQEIIQDGEIKIGGKKEDGTIDRETDELKDLIFQLAFIQMHSDTKNTKYILKHLAEIIETLNDFNKNTDEDKNKNNVLEIFYSKLSEKLFEIVAILKSDLYNRADKDIIPKEEMEIILKGKIFAEVATLDKYEIQKYFWVELCRQLKVRGYNVEQKDFKHVVNQFYAGANEIGTAFEIEGEGGLYLIIKITRKDGFFYGIVKEKDENDLELEQRIRLTFSTRYKSNKDWYVQKFPDKYNLDFWNSNSSEFEILNNRQKRDNFIKELADEIGGYVEAFRKTKNNL